MLAGRTLPPVGLALPTWNLPWGKVGWTEVCRQPANKPLPDLAGDAGCPSRDWEKPEPGLGAAGGSRGQGQPELGTAGAWAWGSRSWDWGQPEQGPGAA